jgi:hypothetical protein
MTQYYIINRGVLSNAAECTSLVHEQRNANTTKSSDRRRLLQEF